MLILLACCLLSCVLEVDFLFSLLLPFFDFDLYVVFFILSFSCGFYAVSSVLVSAATRLAYDMYLDTYVRWSHLFFVWGIRFASVIVCSMFCFLFVFLLRKCSALELLEPYVRQSHLFFVWGGRFASVIVCNIFCFLLRSICFPPEEMFRSRVTGACPVTTDCIVAMG